MPAPCSSSLGDLYSKCVQMVNENKVSVKNAFDLHLIDHMDDIVDSFMGGRKRKSPSTPTAPAAGSGRMPSKGQSMDGEVEHRFHEASCTIEASARIYACRVDCVHTDTYRVLGGLSSADMDGEEEGKEGEKANKKRRICGVNTLEKNEANLIQQSIETDEQSDPMFRRMAAAFDAGGAKGLLLAHLPIAEDLSLVFNGDMPLTRALRTAEGMFGHKAQVPMASLGLGDDVQTARSRFLGSKLCPGQLEIFRRQLWGEVQGTVALPAPLQAILNGDPEPSPKSEEAPAPITDLASPRRTRNSSRGRSPARSRAKSLTDASPKEPKPPAPEMPPLMDQEAPLPVPEFDAAPAFDEAPELAMEAPPEHDGSLALADPEAGQVVPFQEPQEEVVAFDELFQKFCGGGGPNQFAYFDKCWSKLPGEREGKHARPGTDLPALADAESGAIVAAPEAAAETEKKASKRPLFDLSNLDKPIKPIEVEPVHKHQLSDRAVHWQLHKDVPPYMIDRITMPNWQTWSKCDFACLGLRPHLMLKLVRKPKPDTEGPHSFSDLFSTVVVENPEAFPWLSSSRSSRGGPGADAEDAREADLREDGGDEDFDANGLPPHLDVDPQELFLRPDDKVVPGLDANGDLPEMGAGFGEDAPYMAGLDFDLADRPQTVGNTDINYSRNSKFVDVKLVKKHLWDCINEDIEEAKPQKAYTSFDALVDRTVQRMPKGETENLSVAVCFICALHLCNEKGLELETHASRPLGDFNVTGPPGAGA